MKALATLSATRRGRLQHHNDMIHDAAEVAPDFAGPHADHAEAVALKNTVANGVVFGLTVVAMLKAIDFNRYPAGEAGEIQEVAAERVLAADVETLAPQAA